MDSRYIITTAAGRTITRGGIAGLAAHVRTHNLPMALVSSATYRDAFTVDTPDGQVTVTLVAPLAVPCPTCGVAAGVPCQGKTGRSKPPHPKRTRAADQL